MQAVFKVTDLEGTVIETRRTRFLYEANMFAAVLKTRHPEAGIDVAFKDRAPLKDFLALAFEYRVEAFFATGIVGCIFGMLWEAFHPAGF